MTIQECYAKLGGDYEDVVGRLSLEKLVIKFSCKFPDDPSYNELVSALEANDTPTAFRAAHTLKGVCQNLGFQQLFLSANACCEALRAGDLEGGRNLLPAVTADYQVTIDALKEYMSQEG